MEEVESRTTRSSRNVTVSVLAQVVFVVLGFITRTIFVAELGVAVLGINTLITSVLAMLALADLGLNGAFMYALYRPLKEGRSEQIAPIVQYAAILYRRVALIVLVLGFAFAPFVHKLVRLDTPIEQIELYYVILLLNTGFSYLMQSRVILLNADQRIYITKTYSMVFNTLRSVAQIISLLVFGSFLIYLVLQIVFTLSNNLAVYIRAGRIYPFIKSQSVKLAKTDRNSIMRSMRSMLIYRVGSLVLNQATPVLISVFVGTLILGYYSNYFLIIGAAVMITEVAFAALTPSMGNLYAGNDRDAQNKVFDSVNILSVLVHGAAAVCIFTLIDDVIELWLGEQFQLPLVVVVCIVFNFYLAGTIRPLWSFLSATGLFSKTRTMIVLTAFISVVLALVLGNLFGLAGIVIAPPLAQLATQAWFEPWILMKYQLSRNVFPYFRIQVGAFLLWTTMSIFIFLVGERVPGGAFASLAVKIGLLVTLFPVATWFVFRKVYAFQSLIRQFRIRVLDRA